MIKQKFGIYTRVIAEINKVLQIGNIQCKDVALINEEDISNIEEIEINEQKEAMTNGESE